MFTPSITPQGEQSNVRRIKGQTEGLHLLEDSFTPIGKIHLWGPTSPLLFIFYPGSEIKN
jgi:hypothetical protein